MHRFQHLIAMLVCNLFDDDACVAVDIIEFERLRCDHGAQRMPLAPR